MDGITRATNRNSSQTYSTQSLGAIPIGYRKCTGSSEAIPIGYRKCTESSEAVPIDYRKCTGSPRQFRLIIPRSIPIGNQSVRVRKVPIEGSGHR